MLVDPGKGNNYSDAAVFAEYSAPMFFENGVDAESPAVHILSYHDAFKGSGPERSMSEIKLDLDNKEKVYGIANNLEQGATIQRQWSQQTSVETSTNTNVKYGQTLTTQSQTGVTVGGKGTYGSGGSSEASKLGGEVNLGFSQQWTKSELESYENAAGSGWKETMSTTRQVTVSETLPKGFKGVMMLYPYTQRRLDWVESRLHDGRGHIMGSHIGTEKRWVGFNVPANHLTVIGSDPKYMAALEAKFTECERQYHAALTIEREFNIAAGAAKIALGTKLDEAKSKLGRLIEDLLRLQPSEPDSMADADAQASVISKPTGKTVARAEVNTILHKMRVLDQWTVYIGDKATGAPFPSAPVAAPTGGK
jgi:hypothetical protein